MKSKIILSDNERLSEQSLAKFNANNKNGDLTGANKLLFKYHNALIAAEEELLECEIVIDQSIKLLQNINKDCYSKFSKLQSMYNNLINVETFENMSKELEEDIKYEEL